MDIECGICGTAKVVGPWRNRNYAILGVDDANAFCPANPCHGEAPAARIPNLQAEPSPCCNARMVAPPQSPMVCLNCMGNVWELPR